MKKSSHNNIDKDFVKRLKRAIRERDLELRNNMGFQRSKTFGGKPSNKETRRKEKQRLKDLKNKGIEYGEEKS